MAESNSPRLPRATDPSTALFEIEAIAAFGAEALRVGDDAALLVGRALHALEVIQRIADAATDRV